MVAAAVSLADPREAEACSCGYYENLRIAPLPDATDVPLNARISVTGVDVEVVVLREVVSGVIVPLEVELRQRARIATPTNPLAPNTTYEIMYGAGGWPEQTQVFTTGAVEDHVPPEFDGLTQLQVDTMAWPVPSPDGSVCISSCYGVIGTLERVELVAPAPREEVAFAQLELIRAVDRVPIATIDLWPTDRSLGWGGCRSFPPDLEPGVDYCARLVMVDVAGNTSDGGVERCSTSVACMPAMDSSCAPVARCTPIEPGEPSEVRGCATTSGGEIVLALGVLGVAWSHAAKSRRRARPRRVR